MTRKHSEQKKPPAIKADGSGQNMSDVAHVMDYYDKLFVYLNMSLKTSNEEGDILEKNDCG